MSAVLAMPALLAMLVVLVFGVVADVVHMQLQQAFFLGALEDGVRKGTVEQTGQNGQDVDAHAGAD